MAEQWYSTSKAAADLAAAGLLDGIILPGARGPEFHPPRDQYSGLPGKFRGAGLDSRGLTDDQLFVALKGDHVDGRNFISSAMKAGHWVLADHADKPHGRELPLSENPPSGTGIFLTRDINAALAVLAGTWRSSLELRVAGITGTNGKTTTKDLLAAMLGAAGPTWATAGNFNNHLGLPLTLLGLTRAHKYGVIEMGASAVGDIAHLAPLAAPETAVITNAAPAHLAEFGSLAEIIQGKGEILDVLPTGGCAVLNADSPGFTTWKDRAPCDVVSFGRTKADHVWNWSGGGTGQNPELELDGESWPVPLPGEHNGANLAAAVLAARSLGLSDTIIRQGLTGFSGSPHRGIVLEMGGRLILDDCYNANPTSMLAAGRALGKMVGQGRAVAILGAMAELGGDSDAIHEKTGRDLADGPVELLIAVGEKARSLVVGFDAGGRVGHYCDELTEAARLAARHTGAGDCLLIKGSRSAAMEDILPLLDAAFGDQEKN